MNARVFYTLGLSIVLAAAIGACAPGATSFNNESGSQPITGSTPAAGSWYALTEFIGTNPIGTCRHTVEALAQPVLGKNDAFYLFDSCTNETTYEKVDSNGDLEIIKIFTGTDSSQNFEVDAWVTLPLSQAPGTYRAFDSTFFTNPQKSIETVTVNILGSDYLILKGGPRQTVHYIETDSLVSTNAVSKQSSENWYAPGLGFIVKSRDLSPGNEIFDSITDFVRN
ncbi:MAG TPA: hypothetical protein VG537_00980 [Candidatus Kapabacteria bacterium]|jgi:hypothetical protein|nr:hypothetical protein [Candidatus Kapabacteria bacterium]